MQSAGAPTQQAGTQQPSFGQFQAATNQAGQPRNGDYLAALGQSMSGNPMQQYVPFQQQMAQQPTAMMQPQAQARSQPSFQQISRQVIQNPLQAAFFMSPINRGTQNPGSFK